MAKLNITFVNEVGNNLNRYRAIDINTNEEFIFDLSRNGTITTPGTPLNAERLNAIVEAINSMDTEKQEQIDTLNNKTDKLREDFDNSFTEKSVTRKIRKLVDYPSKEISYPDQNVTLKQLGGMSYKYNQLSQITNSKTEYGLTITNNNNGTLSIHGTYDGTASYNQVKISKEYNFKRDGTKYLFLINKDLGCQIGLGGYGGNNNRYYFFSNINNTDWKSSFVILPTSGLTINADNIVISIVDLTAIYGTGNEPATVQQFLADYPMYNSYVEYTEGDIINAAVSSVDSVGANIWDEEWEIVNERLLSKNLISVIPNTTYYGKVRLGYDVLYHDINGDVIGNWEWHSINNLHFTTPSNCYFIKFQCTAEYGTTYKHDICINVSDTNFNGTYEPYKHNNYPIPSSIQALEGYGWGVNESCYNYIDFENKKFVKKVGRVDLGELTWIYEGNVFGANLLSVGDKGLSTKYERVDTVATENQPNNTIQVRTGIVYIKDTAYTDATAFKAAMSGVYLYYELATPVEVDIVALNNYPVWQYGTETQNAILPAIMIKEYSISTLDQIVKNIEVDANQTDMIEKLVEKDLAIDNSIKNITTQQTNHSSAISDLSDRVVDLELYKIDKSKLTLQQNLIKTKLLYDGVVISEVNSADVMVTPKIYISVERVTDSSFNEILKVENNTNYDMYVSMNGQGTHSKFNVPSGLTKTSSKTISIGAGGIPENYTANIELEVYFNSNTTYNDTVGSTIVKNKKIINLFADVTTTNK